jgi:hypothetical protein
LGDEIIHRKIILLWILRKEVLWSWPGQESVPVSMIINLCAPYKAGDFLANRKIISFSRRILTP